MLLYLMRHGLAADGAASPGMPDAERPLTPDGMARVGKMAQALSDLGAEVDLVLASPLRRAAQTAEIVARELQVRRRTTPALTPGSPPSALIDEVRKLKVRGVLGVGHSPHLELIIAKAVADSGSPFCELKKAGVACLDLEKQTGRALLAWLLQPGVVKRLR